MTTDGRAGERTLDEIVAAFLEAQDRGESPRPDEWIARHPAHAEELARFLGADAGLGRIARAAVAREDPAGLGRSRVVGDYEILDEIARGGMGVVYRARHTRLDREVALKMILGGRLASEEDVRRFRREAHALARLDHEHIVPIYDVGEHEGLPYFTMKLVKGGPLSDAKELFASGDFRDAARLIATVAGAIQSAHEAGILHRDLKPANVLLDADGEPHVTDFGLARRIGSDTRLTFTGAALGTPNYMPPEQASSSGATEVSPASDVYSLGAILYELLTGRPPFSGSSSADVLRDVTLRDPVPPRRLRPDVPRDLETIALKCLEKSQRRRYASARDLEEELRLFLDGRPIRARRVTGAERAWRWCRRNPAAVAVGSLLLATAIGATAAFFVIRHERNIALESLDRAETAEEAARQRLRDSLLAESRALRGSDHAGRRERALAALAKAAQIRPGLDLRDEAVAALALADARLDPPFLDAYDFRAMRLALDPGSELAARCDATGRLSFFSRATGAESGAIRGPEAMPTLVDLSPDGRFVAALFGHPSGDLVVWDRHTSEEKLRTTAFVNFIAVAFDPAGRRIAVGTRDGEILVHDLAADAEVVRFPTLSHAVALAFSPDGKRLASAHVRDAPLVFDLEALRPAVTLDREGAVNDILFSSDGESLFAAAPDGRILVFDAETGLEARSIPAHARDAMDLALADAGRTLVTRGLDDTVRTFDARTGTPLVVIEGSVPDRLLVTGGDGREIGVFGDGGRGATARLLPSEALARSAPASGGQYRSLDFSPDGRLLAAASDEGVALFDLASMDGVAPAATIPLSGVVAAVFEPSSGSLVVCAERSLHRFPVSEVAPGTLVVGPPHRLLAEESDAFLALAAGGTRLAVSTRSGHFGEEVLVIDSNDPHAPPRRIAHRGVRDVALSPDGRFVASSPWNGVEARLHDLDAPPEAAARVLAEGRTSGNARFSFTGRYLSMSTTASHRVLDTETWRVAIEATSISDRTPGCAAFSRDERTIALLSTRRAIDLLDTETGERLARFAAPDSDTVEALAFSPCGRFLIAAQQSLAVWDIAAIRGRLREIGLDWDAGEIPTPTPAAPRLVRVDMGSLDDPREWARSVPRAELEAALERNDARVAAEPGDEGALLARAAILERLSRRAEAIDALSRSMDLAPPTEAQLVERARLAQALGRSDEEIVDWTTLLSRKPHDLSALYARGRALVRVNRLEEAAADFAAILEARPDHAAAATSLAWILVTGPESIRDGSRALELAERATRARPTDPGAWSTLGGARTYLGRDEEAVDALLRAIALRPGGGRSADHLFLAISSARLGDAARAVSHFERALSHEDSPARAGEFERLHSLRLEAEEAIEKVLRGR